MIVRQPNGRYLITQGKEYKFLEINLYPLQVRQWYMDKYEPHYTDEIDISLTAEMAEADAASKGFWWGFMAEYQDRYGKRAAKAFAKKVGDFEYAKILEVSA